MDWLTYLPQDRRQALAYGQSLPESTSGSVVFADISGFTALTETLALAFGPRRGAEAMTQQLNVVYAALIAVVEAYGGSVISFSGDAITCWFEGAAARAATTSALAMQHAMHHLRYLPLPNGAEITLGLKVAVASGPVDRWLLGDPALQLHDLLLGQTVSRVIRAEQVARQGEVVLDPATVAAVEPALTITDWRIDPVSKARFAVVNALEQPLAPLPPPGSLPPLAPEQRQRWLGPALTARTEGRDGSLLAELRPAVVLFLRFSQRTSELGWTDRSLLDHLLRWTHGQIVQYEGTLLQVTVGDKGAYLYATFGAPVAHENDAAQAVATALALRKLPAALAPNVALQFGLSQGLMWSGDYGGPTRSTYGVLGDPVNLAARLMERAAPGQILASPALHQTLHAAFEWQALPPMPLKGKRTPLAVWAVTGPTRQPGLPLGQPSNQLPLVGRANELALLTARWEQARTGQGQIVGLCGQAGIGKSRLIAELIGATEHSPGLLLLGTGQSYATQTPYLIWQAIWRSFFGLDAQLGSAEALALLEAQLAELNPALLPRLPLLSTVLDLAIPASELTQMLDPRLRKESLETLLLACLRARAHHTPILIVLDDYHWHDPLSHELLERLSRSLVALPIMIIVAYRPSSGQLDDRAAWPWLTLPLTTELQLTALSSGEARDLIQHKLRYWGRSSSQPSTPALDRLIAAISERAEGNPFYLDELLNYLHDQGIDLDQPHDPSRLELPDSLHRLILSRIDQLSGPQQQLIKVASITGRVFRVAWLCGYYPEIGSAPAVRAQLDLLAQLEVVVPEPAPSDAFVFKQIVTQEVTYASLPFATRTLLHGQFAHYIEQQADPQGRALDLLAYHYSHSDNLPKQREYLDRAAAAAHAAYANTSALDYYGRLLPLLVDPRSEADIRLRMAEVLRFLGQTAEADAQCLAAQALAEQLDDQALRFRCLFGLGTEASLEELIGQARRLNDQHAIAEGLVALGRIYSWAGDVNAAQPLLVEATMLAQQFGDQALRSHAESALGGLAWREGAYAAAEQHFRASMELAQASGNRRRVAAERGNLALIAIARGDLPAARQYLLETLHDMRTLGDYFNTANALHNLGDVALQQRDFAAAEAYLRESMDLRREANNPHGVVSSQANLGLVYLAQHNLATAQAAFADGLRLIMSIDANQLLIMWCLLGLAGVAAERGASPALDHAQLIRATRLAAAAEAIRLSNGIALEPDGQQLYDRILATTRAALDRATFASTWTASQNLPIATILTEALDEEI